jgi:hypothetical protein
MLVATMTVRQAGLTGIGVVVALFGLSACGGSAHPKTAAVTPVVIPSVTPSSTVKPHPAKPGAACGRVSTETGAPVSVVVVKGRVSCAEATAIFTKYYNPQTIAEGAAGLAVVDKWTCQKVTTKATHTVATCDRKDAEIETRTH